MKRLLVLLITMCLAVPVVAQTGLPPAPYANRQLDDPQQEASQVRERIAAGETPEQVRSWLIERYGNWVSYNPPIASAVTWPLWIAPIILLLAALWLARGRFRKPKDDE